MVLWAQSGRDEYPLPSFSDTGNYVLSVDDATQKDTTANIYSLLIFGNYFSPELLVSPSEQSPDIQIDTDYNFTSPPSALNPSMALWDPAFSADFTDGKIGNTSYAHHIPASDRRSRWASTLQSDQAIVGNRGPEVSAVHLAKSTRPIPQFNIPSNSVTLQIHGGRTTWEGNIAYNDNHVNFETNVFSDNAVYKETPPTPGAMPRKIPDIFFFDEPNAVNNDNAFLSIFTKAGPTTKDFKPIWD